MKRGLLKRHHEVVCEFLGHVHAHAIPNCIVKTLRYQWQARPVGKSNSAVHTQDTAEFYGKGFEHIANIKTTVTEGW